MLLVCLSADIELDDNIDSDAQIKSNGLPGNATAVSVNICNTSQTPTSKSSSAHVDLSKQLLNKQLLQQRDDDKEQAGPKDNDQDSDNEEYYYTHVPSRNDRNAAEVVGRLKGACTGVQPGLSAAPAETGHDSDDAACLEYRSLDPEAMDPTHMYHEMRSNSADGPQPTYSEPGVHGHRKLNGHRPTPPMKAPPRPPRPRGGESKLTSHVPLTSVPSVDGEYVDPNNRNSHLYQGLTPERQEYLALYMTPDSSPH